MNAALKNIIIRNTEAFARINNYNPRLVFDLEYRNSYIDFVTNNYDEENTPFNVTSGMKNLCSDLLKIVKLDRETKEEIFTIDMVNNVKFLLLSLIEVLAPHWGGNYPLHTPVLINLLRETTDPIFNANGLWLNEDGSVVYGNKITNKKGIILPATQDQIDGFINSINDTSAEEILNNYGRGNDTINFGDSASTSSYASASMLGSITAPPHIIRTTVRF